MEPEVSIEGLVYRYRGQQKPALEGVDLEVAEGEFVVVMGPSGAGKSTLCVSLNGLIPHFFRGKMEGEVRVGGRSTREGKVGEFAQEVGLVFQDFEAQLFSTNVALEVAFGPENFGVERGEMVGRVERVLGQVRLGGFENRTPATLSGGQKQRLAIASVLAIEPRILCLDEPTTDLDPIGKLGIFEIAEDLKDRDDVTLIVVEHETEETLDADRIIVLQGRQDSRRQAGERSPARRGAPAGIQCHAAAGHPLLPRDGAVAGTVAPDAAGGGRGVQAAGLAGEPGSPPEARGGRREAGERVTESP